MPDELTNIFAECMEAIEEGRLSVAECLAQYPQHRAELGDLLQVATEMQAIPSVRPSQAMREQVPARLLENLQPRPVRPVRTPVGETVGGVATLAAVLLLIQTQLRQLPQRLAQIWPGIPRPAMAMGISIVGAFILLLGAGMMTALGASVLHGIQERSAASKMVSVEALSGVVEVLGADGKWMPVSKQTTITTDYRIRTGDGSRAKIVFADGRVASLGPNSEVNLSQLINSIPSIGGTITGTVTVTPTVTTTPTVTITPTTTITPTPTITPTATVTGLVTICHKPGTPAEQTMTLPAAALGGHLGHGDTMGPCTEGTPQPPPPQPTATPAPPTPPGNGGGNGAGTVTICHKPGTPAQQTMVVPQSAVAGHLNHGDTLGACN